MFVPQTAFCLTVPLGEFNSSMKVLTMSRIQRKIYKTLPATHEDSIEFRNDTRENGKKINTEHQDAQEKYTESILSEMSGKIEKVLKDYCSCRDVVI